MFIVVTGVVAKLAVVAFLVLVWLVASLLFGDWSRTRIVTTWAQRLDLTSLSTLVHRRSIRSTLSLLLSGTWTRAVSMALSSTSTMLTSHSLSVTTTSLVALMVATTSRLDATAMLSSLSCRLSSTSATASSLRLSPRKLSRKCRRKLSSMLRSRVSQWRTWRLFRSRLTSGTSLTTLRTTSTQSLLAHTYRSSVLHLLRVTQAGTRSSPTTVHRLLLTTWRSVA